MSDTDSDDGAPLKRVRSVSAPSEWDKVPKETDFKFKFKTRGKKSVKLLYTLKKDVCLPYTATIEDIEDEVTFTRSMDPKVEGKYARKDGEFWIIEEDISPSSMQPLVNQSQPVGSSQEDTLNQSQEVELDASNDINDSVYDYDPDLEKAVIRFDTTEILQFHCTFCSFISEISFVCKDHVLKDHENWKVELTKSAQKSPTTPHNYPNWLTDLTGGDFKDLVISQCSQRVRDAVNSDENIQDPRLWKEVYDHIINTTISHLETIFSGVAVPRLCDMRELATELAVVYPTMFRGKRTDDACKAMDGFKPKTKVLNMNDLAKLIIDRFRKRAVKKRQLENPESQEKNPKKGKKKLIYGVDGKKAQGVLGSPEIVSAMAKTNSEESFAEREKVYEANRPVIQHHFSNSPNRIMLICKGFMKDSQHLANQFEWLTNSSSLLEKIKKNFITQLGHLERFLRYMNQTVEFEEEMARVENICEIEHGGSLLYKHIMVLRFGARYLDSDGSCLIRMEEDGPAKTSGPHIFAVSVHRSYVFELHAEKEKLIGNMDLQTSIAALLHLAFVVNLKYGKECQTMCDILQRKVADYGDDSGTKTHGSKSAAKSKYEKYLDGLGRALSQ